MILMITASLRYALMEENDKKVSWATESDSGNGQVIPEALNR